MCQKVRTTLTGSKAKLTGDLLTKNRIENKNF